VNYVNQIGALWTGNGKDILVPFKSKPSNGKGKRYLVYLYMDEKQIV
jgi:predicted RNA-binding protein (virulence factor B family)